MRQRLGEPVEPGWWDEKGEVVDMPDRRVSLLVRLRLQNGGRLARGRRADFAELTDPELERTDAAVQRATREAGPGLPAPAVATD